MREGLFPLLGALFAITALLPASALVTKALFFVLDRCDGAGLHASGTVRYALLVGSSLVPIAWLLSAAVHQAESLRSSSACALPHEREALCLEPAGFAAAVLLLVGGWLVFRAVRGRARSIPDRSERGACALARAHTLISERGELAALARRIRVVAEPGHLVATRGWFAPQVVVGTELVLSLDDDGLAATLGHELEHVRGLDPLRYGLLSCATALNPLGRILLGRELARWVLAREAHCDRVAVARGANALALADAIVRAARPRGEQPALGGEVRAIGLRIDLLLGYADARPHRCCEDMGLRALSIPLAVAIALPHFASTALLDAVHAGSELLGLFLLGG